MSALIINVVGYLRPVSNYILLEQYSGLSSDTFGETRSCIVSAISVPCVAILTLSARASTSGICGELLIRRKVSLDVRRRKRFCSWQAVPPPTPCFFQVFTYRDIFFYSSPVGVYGATLPFSTIRRLLDV